MECQRDKFSLPSELHYLNCAFMAPMSNHVATAAQEVVERLRVPSRFCAGDFFEQSDAVRRLFARLVGVPDARRVAIVPSVSYAMATLAKNTPLRPGSNVVILAEQFPSNVYTWKRACDASGADLRTVLPRPTAGSLGAAWNEALLEAIDETTAIVAIPQLHWTDGTKFDVERIGRKARQCGARLVLDGTQSVGALPFDVDRFKPDALVCAGYKWLTGPYSVGLAYFGPAYDNGVPLEENWITRLGSEDFTGLVRYNESYQPGAVRYDMGERSNFVLLPMLEAGMSQVLEWTPEAIQNYCAALVADAIPALRDLGCRIEDADARAAHLFGVRVPADVDMETLRATLSASQVSVSIRGTAIRVAPHVYNDDDDLAALVETIARMVSSSAHA